MAKLKTLCSNNYDHRCNKITVGNHKGGCGKTALSLALAFNIFRQGHSVLLIDMDQQGSLGKQLNLYGNNEKHKDYRLSKIYRQFKTLESSEVNTPLCLCESKDPASNASIYILLGDHDLKDAVETTEAAIGDDGEIVVRERFTELMNIYSREFDYIIFDTTPVIEKVKSCAHALNVSDCIVIPIDSYDAIDEIDQTMDAIVNNNRREPNIVFVCTKYTKDSQADAKKFDEQCKAKGLKPCIKPVYSVLRPRKIGHDERRNTFYRFMLQTFPDNMCKAGIPDKTDIERHKYIGADKENQEIIDDVCKEILLKACKGAKGEIENLCNAKLWHEKRALLNGYIGILRDENIKKLDLQMKKTMFKYGGKVTVQFDKEETHRRVLLEREAFKNK